MVTYNLFIFNIQMCDGSGRSQYPAIMNLAYNHEEMSESQLNTGNMDVKKKKKTLRTQKHLENLESNVSLLRMSMI